MVLTEFQKMNIITKYNNDGLSINEIASIMNINRNTVYKWILRYRENKNLSRKRGTGLHKKINN